MEKILATIKDSYGKETPTAILIQENGQLYLWEINCLSSRAHNLGNCECINHEATTTIPVSTAEVIQRFGTSALDGFEAPKIEQIVFDAFGVEIDELETYIRVSYMLKENPLYALRGKNKVLFSDNPETLRLQDNVTVFIINSRGEISVRMT